MPAFRRVVRSRQRSTCRGPRKSTVCRWHGVPCRWPLRSGGADRQRRAYARYPPSRRSGCPPAPARAAALRITADPGLRPGGLAARQLLPCRPNWRYRPKPAGRHGQVAPKQPDGQPSLFLFGCYEAPVHDLTAPAKRGPLGRVRIFHGFRPLNGRCSVSKLRALDYPAYSTTARTSMANRSWECWCFLSLGGKPRSNASAWAASNSYTRLVWNFHFWLAAKKP